MHIMLSINEFVNSLPQRELEMIIDSPTIQEAFIEDVVLEHGFDKTELKKYLLELKPTNNSAEEIEIPLKISKPAPQWDKGESFVVKHKKATLMNEVLDVLNEYNGLSKSAILLKIGKDNVSWRTMFDDIIEYMIARDSVKKISTKYYISNNSIYRECDFHRKLYSLLYAGPKTTTSLMKSLNYNNPKGRSKVLQALNMMVNEKIVQRESKYWVLLD